MIISSSDSIYIFLEYKAPFNFFYSFIFTNQMDLPFSNLMY